MHDEAAADADHLAVEGNLEELVGRRPRPAGHRPGQVNDRRLPTMENLDDGRPSRVSGADRVQLSLRGGGRGCSADQRPQPGGRQNRGTQSHRRLHPRTNARLRETLHQQVYAKSVLRAPRAATNSARTARRRRPCLNHPGEAGRDAASSLTRPPGLNPGAWASSFSFCVGSGFDRAFIERLIRWASVLTERTRTSTSSPSWTTSLARHTRLWESSEMWTSPSTPGSNSTNAPNSINLVTFPRTTLLAGYFACGVGPGVFQHVAIGEADLAGCRGRSSRPGRESSGPRRGLRGDGRRGPTPTG